MYDHPKTQLVAAVYARLAAEPSWRAVLIADPRTAIGELLGVALPESTTVIVHEDTAGQIHVVVPSLSEEIDIAALDFVAGGYGPYDFLNGAAVRFDPTNGLT